MVTIISQYLCCASCMALNEVWKLDDDSCEGCVELGQVYDLTDEHHGEIYANLVPGKVVEYDFCRQITSRQTG